MHGLYRLENGLPCDQADFEGLLTLLYYRYDCCDFRLLLLIPLYRRFAQSGLLPKELAEDIENTILDFDYWLSPNARFPGKKNMWTENHLMCHHVCELLAAQQFPDRRLRSSGLLGRELLPMARERVLSWIRVKARAGFCEWDSNTYMGVNLESAAILYAHAEDPQIKEQARKLLDLIFLGMAVNVFKGAYSGTHGRAYSDAIKDETCEQIHAVIQMVFHDRPIQPKDALSKAVYALICSDYQPAPIIRSIYHACAQEKVLEHFEQQSFNVEDGPLFGRKHTSDEDLTLYWQNMGYTHALVAESMVKLGKKYHINVHAAQPSFGFIRRIRLHTVQNEQQVIAAMGKN